MRLLRQHPITSPERNPRRNSRDPRAHGRHDRCAGLQGRRQVAREGEHPRQEGIRDSAEEIDQPLLAVDFARLDGNPISVVKSELALLAAKLGARDWGDELKTTDDFVAYTVDPDLSDLKANLKASVPAERLWEPPLVEVD
jgi:uncharacterized membrane-anchored protein